MTFFFCGPLELNFKAGRESLAATHKKSTHIHNINLNDMMELDAEEETTKEMAFDDEDQNETEQNEGKSKFERGFDVVSTTLELDVDLVERHIMGIATLNIKRHRPFVKILRLHFRQAEILSVSINDVPVRYERLDFLRRIDCGDRRDAPMFYANYRTAIVAANRGELFVYLSDDDERETPRDLRP